MRCRIDNVNRILGKCRRLVWESRPELPHQHCHLFCRTRAMHLLEAGVPMPTISDWLGHSRIENTRIHRTATPA
ncbi:MAG: tyrosine-type recombinase/integrase [Desulfovibrionaceae bacterium]|nr:tyrosine-type recombinase/integrase [Desulfovibrionaceae bacterium]